jgi:hypothetical protein
MSFDRSEKARHVEALDGIGDSRLQVGVQDERGMAYPHPKPFP